MSQIVYSKFSNERHEKFNIRTDIIENDNKYLVKKTALNIMAKEHLHDIYQRYFDLSKEYLNTDIKINECIEYDEGLDFEYITGETLEEKLDDLLIKREYSEIIKTLKKFVMLIQEGATAVFKITEQFVHVFGNLEIPIIDSTRKTNNIDFIFTNIIVDSNNVWNIIDYEWTFNFPIPTKFIIYRALHFYLYDSTKRNDLHKLGLFQLFEISDDEIKVFDRMENKFQMFIKGQEIQLGEIYKYIGKKCIDITPLVEKERTNINDKIQVFLDKGNGFNEIDAYFIEMNFGLNEFIVHVCTENKQLRIDPASRTCMVKINKISDKFDSYHIINYITNGVNIGKDIYLFEGVDPQIIIPEVPESVDELYISLVINAISPKVANELSVYNQEKLSSIDKLESDKYAQFIEIDHLKQSVKEQSETFNRKTKELLHENIVLNNRYNEIYNSTIWRMTLPIRNVFNFYEKIRLNEKKIENSEYKNKNEYNIKFSVDKFEYNGNVLLGTGWLFSIEGKVENVNIVIRNAYIDKSIECLFGLEREDVYSVFQNNYARYSGFDFEINIEYFKKAKIFLGYTLNSVKQEVFLGEIKEGFFRRINNFMSTLNIKKIQRFYFCIKEGRLLQRFKMRNQPTIITQSYNNNLIELSEFVENNIVEKVEYFKEIYDECIDIIIPIYNGYDFLDRLFTSIAKTQMKYRLILINDKSTDSRIMSYLEKLDKKNIILINNEKNIGFVQSVNKGLEVIKNHVALLNTDIELPENWLERLLEPIILNNDVATTTPFTNCGTVCSFPEFGKDNELFEGIDAIDIDKCFQKINPNYTDMPTGVGFCMGMNKSAISQIGLFDAATFSKGYGEENDWCQRAIEIGYRNIHVENLFVYHKHGGSFLTEEKKQLIKKNSLLLLKKHPNYNVDVANYCQVDPQLKIRTYMMLQLIIKYKASAVKLFITHNIGGGAENYLQKRKKVEIFDNNAVIIVKYDYVKGLYLLDIFYKEYQFHYYLSNFEELDTILNILSVDSIYINELVSYPKLYEKLISIIKLKNKYNCELIMLVHDYYAVCPVLNLLDTDNSYCRVPNIDICESCIAKNTSKQYMDYISMKKWRSGWNYFLKQCNEIVVFSQSTKMIFEKAYAILGKCVIVPHELEFMPQINKSYKTTQRINIGLIGVLSNHKGISIINSMLKIIEKQDLNIKIILIGYSLEKIESSNFMETGKYTSGMLPNLVLQYDIDIFMISSICPETFSYTTSEVMQMGYPIAAFDLGAPAERIEKYNKGLILSNVDAQVAIDEIQLFMQNNSFLLPYKKKRILFIIEDISFASRYRVEHLVEKLLMYGIQSDIITVEKELDNLGHFDTVIIYRCKLNKKIEKIILLAKSLHIKLIYDIDDLVFDYSKVKNLEFLKAKEYKNFKENTELIYECMKLCDEYMTSTETLASEIRNVFSDKNVFVCRNMASMEMQILSHKAIYEKTNNNDKVVLGYFSGSKTHDNDFAIIENIILKLMNKIPNLYLRVGGCLTLSEKFDEFGTRIERLPFQDWRKLPELIANIDINLMPLETTLFQTCKSENKWMEAALVKVVTVASENDELKRIITDGVNGYLCNNAIEWEEKLSKLVMNKELRNEISQSAFETVEINYITNVDKKVIYEHF